MTTSNFSCIFKNTSKLMVHTLHYIQLFMHFKNIVKLMVHTLHYIQLFMHFKNIVKLMVHTDDNIQLFIPLKLLFRKGSTKSVGTTITAL